MTHVLIIDDNDSNLGVLTQLLSMHNMTYTTVQNPTKIGDVLECLDDVGLILLDLEMPYLNGYQVFDIIKASSQAQDIPIIACTVHTNEMWSAREMGFNGFISKPFNMDIFNDQLDQILSGKPVWYAY